MKKTRFVLQKNENSEAFFYTDDASDILSLSSGCVQIQIILDAEVSNGIYSKCSQYKYFTDYLFFSVNQEGNFINYPGMYAAFSSEGIVFCIWTSYGKFYVIDKTSNIVIGESSVIEFCWDSSGGLLGSGAKMAIFVDGICSASGNFSIKNDSLAGINFFAADSKNSDFNLTCLISDFVCYSELPAFRFYSVDSLTNIFSGERKLILGGKNGFLVWNENIDNTPAKIFPFYLSGNLNKTISACDVSGNVFIAKYYDDGFKSGGVYKYNLTSFEVLEKLEDLKYPICLSVIQRDGIDYPKYTYYDNTECIGVWIGSNNTVLRTDNNLNVESELSSFSEISSLTCLDDMSCWLSDRVANKVYHISYDGEVLTQISISSPTFICSTANDRVYVYSSSTSRIYAIYNEAIVKNKALGFTIIGMDCDKNTEKLLICKQDGTICSYNKNFLLLDTYKICENPSSILVRRGHSSDSFYVVDEVSSKIYLSTVSDLSNKITEKYFDKSILVNGSIFETAQSDVKVSFSGEFSMPFTIGMAVVNEIDVQTYNVNKKQVDLSAGGFNEAYLNTKGILSVNDPTDLHGNVIETSEISVDD